jgi:Na+/H+ antiporter NhaD/arsenite permease-like protein
MGLDEREAIAKPRLLVQSLAVLALVMAGFVAHPVLHIDPSIVALLGAGALVAVSRLDPDEYLAEVEWPTLVFFAGLFVMVGALVQVGVVAKVGHALTEAVGDRYLLAGSGVLWASAALSGIIDNIPYVATMAPIISDMTSGSGAPGQARALWWALALGADLGGNATAVGASANVVIIGIAARNGHRISFWQFTRYGVVVAVVTVAVAWGYLWLRYFAFA